MEIPKNLASAVDLFYKTREKRLQMQKKVDEVKEFESRLREHLIQNISSKDFTGVAGRVARATVTKKFKPRVFDWDKFYQFVHRNKAYELLQRRVNEAAIKERAEARRDKQVPGVDDFIIIDVSVTKVK